MPHVSKLRGVRSAARRVRAAGALRRRERRRGRAIEAGEEKEREEEGTEEEEEGRRSSSRRRMWKRRFAGHGPRRRDGDARELASVLRAWRKTCGPAGNYDPQGTYQQGNMLLADVPDPERKGCPPREAAGVHARRAGVRPQSRRWARRTRATFERAGPAHREAPSGVLGAAGAEKALEQLFFALHPTSCGLSISAPRAVRGFTGVGSTGKSFSSLARDPFAARRPHDELLAFGLQPAQLCARTAARAARTLRASRRLLSCEALECFGTKTTRAEALFVAPASLVRERRLRRSASAAGPSTRASTYLIRSGCSAARPWCGAHTPRVAQRP